MRERPHFDGLDGLRAVAVVLVVWFHYGALPGLHRLGVLSHPRAGYLGAQLFFVVSGFLITSLLLAEGASNGRVDVQRFIIRRMARLLPPLLVVLVVLVTTNVFRSHAVHDTVVAVAAVLGYVFNVVAYFHTSTGQLGGDGWGHLWSLSVEEQFYLVWAFAMGVYVRRRNERAVAMCVSAAVAIGLWRTWLWLRGVSTLRLYLPTDVRADGVLWGASLALWQSRRRHRELSGHRIVSAALAVAILGFAFLGSPWDTAASPGWMYGPGFTVFSLVAVALIAEVTVDRRTPVDRLLNSRSLQAIGRRSYGLYLFHEPMRSLAEGRPAAFELALVGTLICTEASYRLLETPLRRRWSKRGSTEGTGTGPDVVASERVGAPIG